MPHIKGKMFNYSENQMKDAIADVQRGVPIATAAKRFGVPRITLMYKAKGKTLVGRKMGPVPILINSKEDLLVEWIITVAKAGFAITKIELLDSVQHLIKELNRKNPLLNDRPGRTWYEAFLKRHQQLSTRMTQNLTSSGAAIRNSLC